MVQKHCLIRTINYKTRYCVGDSHRRTGVLVVSFSFTTYIAVVFVLLVAEKISTNNSLHLAWKCTQIFVHEHLFQKPNNFLGFGRIGREKPWACGTDNVQRQISEYIFLLNGGYCVYFPSIFPCNMSRFENWGMTQMFPSFN